MRGKSMPREQKKQGMPVNPGRPDTMEESQPRREQVETNRPGNARRRRMAQGHDRQNENEMRRNRGDEGMNRSERRDSQHNHAPTPGMRDAEADAKYAWRKAFSDGSENRRKSATQAVARAKHQMDISVADAKQKKQPNAFFSIILAILMFVVRLVGAFIKLIWRFLVVLAVTLVAIGMIGLIGAGYLYATTLADIPQLENFSLIAMPQDSTIYDRDGEVIGVISTSKREPVAFNQIAQSAKDAVVCIEDARFYNHEGVDFIGIVRALLSNFRSWTGGGGVSQGASTITQQYVRNAYQNVGNDVSIKRKLTEMMLAAQLEAQESKDDILNSYLNTIYYGNGCYGIEAASKYYFDKSANDLDYYESAVLAAIINGPTIYNPATEDGRTNTASRANIILDKMYSSGKLGEMSQDELRALKQTNISERIHITEKERVVNQPFYYDYVMRELRDQYPEEQIVSGGWQIYTTLSIKDGNAATDVVRSVEDAYGDEGATAVIVDMNVSDGSVNSFCGGTDYAVSQYNAAIDSRLQNGSTLKPFLYATMIDKDGYFATDLVNCDPIDIAGEGEEEHVITSYLHGGMHTIEEGIIQSDNAMAIRCAQSTGMDRIGQMLKACGATHDLEQNVVAIIGGSEMGYTPLEMATVYTTLANGGMARSTWCIRSITDTYGNTVFEHEDDSTKAMEPETAKQVTHSMQEAVKQRGDWYDFPFASKGGWHVAAKSGTTDDRSDLWCCAFDHNRAAVIWLGGRDARIEMPTTTPTAVRKLSDYFYAVGEGDSKAEFDQPEYKTVVPKPEGDENSDSYTKRIREHHLQARVSYVVDETKKEGAIVSVSNEGKLVPRNTEVKITVVRNKVSVPDFVAIGDPSKAYEEAEGLTLLFTVKYSTSGKVTPSITSQSIKAGESVDHGTTVTLEVSVATPLVEQSETQVPYRGTDDLIAKLNQDRRNLESQNEELKSQIDAMDEELTKLEGDLSDERSRLEEELNTAVTIPNVKNLTVKEARQVLSSVGLTTNTGGATDSDIVTSTTPSIGTDVGSGSSVKLSTQKASGGSSSSSSSSSSTNSGSTGSDTDSGNSDDSGTTDDKDDANA